MKKKGAKVFVGMSGGVDSSVSAALLKRDGYDVTGVFIKVWQPDWIECNWREERLEAMRAAAHLDIPFVTLDLEEEYKKGVIDYMIAEYAAGRTPNPDVMCNREVKFGGFWRWAQEQGADYIATGHYAQNTEIKDTETQDSGFKIQDGKSPKRQLRTGADTSKDQSYFLWTLTQDDLSHVLFPVGHLEKPEVRKLAAKFRLPNANKKDSQGLCFIGKVDVKEFLRHYIPAKPGKVLNEAGQEIGTHTGALLFTIGERHGFEINPKHKTPSDAPYYVIAKNVSANTITVSNKNSGVDTDANAQTVGHMISRASITRTNWIGGTPPAGTTFSARARYRAPLFGATITALDTARGTATVTFTEPQDTITPGQSLVFYDGEVCAGGGLIV